MNKQPLSASKDAEGMSDTPDLVDSFYRDLVRPLGNVAILFAQAEASLLDLITVLGELSESDAHAILRAPNAKQRVLELVRSSGLDGFDLMEIKRGVDSFWNDKERRNRFFHDEWFPDVFQGGTPMTRGLPRRKGSDRVVFGNPNAHDVWDLARCFQEQEHLFSATAYHVRRRRRSDID